MFMKTQSHISTRVWHVLCMHACQHLATFVLQKMPLGHCKAIQHLQLSLEILVPVLSLFRWQLEVNHEMLEDLVLQHTS